MREHGTVALGKGRLLRRRLALAPRLLHLPLVLVQHVRPGAIPERLQRARIVALHHLEECLPHDARHLLEVLQVALRLALRHHDVHVPAPRGHLAAVEHAKHEGLADVLRHAVVDAKVVGDAEQQRHTAGRLAGGVELCVLDQLVEGVAPLQGAGLHHLVHHLKHQRRVARDDVDVVVECTAQRVPQRRGAVLHRRRGGGATAEVEAVLAVDHVQLAQPRSLVHWLRLAIDGLRGVEGVGGRLMAAVHRQLRLAPSRARRRARRMHPRAGVVLRLQRGELALERVVRDQLGANVGVAAHGGVILQHVEGVVEEVAVVVSASPRVLGAQLLLLCVVMLPVCDANLGAECRAPDQPLLRHARQFDLKANAGIVAHETWPLAVRLRFLSVLDRKLQAQCHPQSPEQLDERLPLATHTQCRFDQLQILDQRLVRRRHPLQDLAVGSGDEEGVGREEEATLHRKRPA